MQWFLILAGVFLIAGGCARATDSNNGRGGRAVGIIDAGVPVPTIVAPDTVQAGVSFTATVHTFGSSSCARPAGVELALRPSEARVIPYVRVPGDDQPCTDDLHPHAHPVELRFTRTGKATIVVLGEVMADGSERKRGSITKELVVMP